MALSIALLSGLFLFFFFYALVVTKIAPKTQVKERVQRLRQASILAEQGLFASEKADKPLPFSFVWEMVHQMEEVIIRFVPQRVYQIVAERILQAGKQHIWNVNDWVCLLLIASLVSVLFMSFFAFSVMNLSFLQGVTLVFSSALIGGGLPLVFFDSLIATRRKKIIRQLPEVLDLLCVSVEAGLSFDGAMAKVVERMQGPLIEECQKMLRDIRMGMTRRMALTNMSDRCGRPEVYLFTAAVIQADRLGVSMGKTLLIQSENMRERRRQTVKEQALKAPVKILLPLAIFIFPVLFMVVLLPTVFSILHNLTVMSK
ncbi:tight adherence protein C [Propionispira arboris]|uniref:Tight adherence protein C n=2 Tax=Propionispira arboris TaxID=84035 RepID=A0A1H7C1Y7_9FIRM|nr:tight adherence protein C [Propionispira arboris]